MLLRSNRRLLGVNAGHKDAEWPTDADADADRGAARAALDAGGAGVRGAAGAAAAWAAPVEKLAAQPCALAALHDDILEAVSAGRRRQQRDLCSARWQNH